MGNISKNFSFSEFEKTSHSEYKVKNKITSFDVRDNIVELVETILQPLRDAWGRPLIITSGYRCPELNEKVGGSDTSAHLIGAAADIVPEDDTRMEEFLEFAVDWMMRHPVKFDQIIRERTRLSTWLHIGLRNLKGEQRSQILDMDKR